jgi:DNA-binding NtrC family response regulator
MKRPVRVLFVDDEATFRTVLSRELSRAGLEVRSVASGQEALAEARQEPYDVVLLDIKMPDLDGIEVLTRLKAETPTLEVIMLTGHGTLQNAVKAMKLGAYDFLTKPCALDELEALIHKAAEKKRLNEENVLLRAEIRRLEGDGEMLGRSPAFQEVLALIDKVAGTDSTVLIRGESGVGKEMVARAIHRRSNRASGPFVIVDCGALQETLLESELFGHEKGAFTGAVAPKQGLVELAQGGTLFLDEVGEISPAVQVKLLRVIDTGVYRRLGSTTNRTANVRIIAATHRDLEAMMRQGAFREDLFWRLNVVTIPIPPLRERPEDIPLLANAFASNPRMTGKKPKSIDPEAMEVLLKYPWPGNIRELQNVIERALILSEGPSITLRDLPANLLEEAETSPAKTLQELEREAIARTLRLFGGHRLKAARALGISERSLYRKIKEYRLEDTENTL